MTHRCYCEDPWKRQFGFLPECFLYGARRSALLWVPAIWDIEWWKVPLSFRCRLLSLGVIVRHSTLVSFDQGEVLDSTSRAQRKWSFLFRDCIIGLPFSLAFMGALLAEGFDAVKSQQPASVFDMDGMPCAQ